MAGDVDNLMLEQLKAIGADLGAMRGGMTEMNDRIGDVQTGQQALQGMMFGLAGYMRDIDQRVERLEQKIEAQP